MYLCPKHGRQWMVRDNRRRLYYCQYQEYTMADAHDLNDRVSQSPWRVTLCNWTIEDEDVAKLSDEQIRASVPSVNPYAWNETTTASSTANLTGATTASYNMTPATAVTPQSDVAWLRGRVQEIQAVGRKALRHG